MRFNFLRSSLVAIALCGPVTASAKDITINHITLDLPTSFKASEYARGIETKTPDDEIYVWFETYKDKDWEVIAKEHGDYWNENDVKINEPVTEQKDGPNNVIIEKLNYKDATWKGKPTVLQYFRIGPFGSQDQRIFVTLWASPEGFETHSADVQHMLDTLNVKFAN